MAEIGWTAEAERWLRDIHDYIAETNPEAALRLVQGIYRQAQILRRFPQMGHRYGQASDREVRVLLYGHYRIAYLLRPDGNVDVLGVFHAAMDIDRYLL